MSRPDDVDGSMRRYYAERAATYERVYHRPETQADLRAIEGWLPAVFRGRRVLEVACGTGWWTPFGARHAVSWLATDASPETLAIAQAKALPPHVRFATVDAYTLEGLDEERFDATLAGFWWSHVPRARLRPWLATLHAHLRPGAVVVFLDNLGTDDEKTPISRRDADGNTYQRRTLDDGSTYEVVKNFPSRSDVLDVVAPHALDAEWIEHGPYWALRYTAR